jgi:hypothetical protein
VEGILKPKTFPLSRFVLIRNRALPERGVASTTRAASATAHEPLRLSEAAVMVCSSKQKCA